MTLTWLITREADDVSADRALHLSRGVIPVSVPCVETVAIEWPWAREQLPEGRLVTLFTSRRSVEAWCAAGKPPLGEAASIAPVTSELLRTEGVEPGVVAKGGVVALAQALLAWWQAAGTPRLTVRYPTSNAGLHAPEQMQAMRILSKLVEVDRQLAYEVRAPEGLKASLERALEGVTEWGISFASPSAVNNFFSSGAVLPRPPAQVDCRGSSTRRAWHARRPEGWPEPDCLVFAEVPPPHLEVSP